MKNHFWTKFTKTEIDFILEFTRIPDGATVLDLGCGTGRHSENLADRGFEVTAVDYNNYGLSARSNLIFVQCDARHFTPDGKFDLVLCLYDVIGSFADNCSNEAIARTIFRSMKDDSFAVISVMNIGYLLSRNPRLVNMAANFNHIFSLVPQSTMEKTGDVFDNERILIDEVTNVCYRREQFQGSHGDLPREYIIRDRRFSMSQITEMLEKAGLKVVLSRYVKAGSWNVPYKADEAKEILLICRKSSATING